MNKTTEERAKELYPNCDPVDKLYSALIEDLRATYIAGATENISAEAGDGWTAVEFHEWVGKQGYKLSHYAAKGEAVHLHESKGSTPFHELREGDWRTTKELYQIFKSQYKLIKK